MLGSRALFAKLERLGLSLKEPRTEAELREDLAFQDRAGHIWRDADPAAEWSGALPRALFSLSCVDWRGTRVAARPVADGEPAVVEFARNMHGWDRTVEGRRRLLYQFAWNQHSHELYCLDLLASGQDPPVFTMQHDSGEVALEADRISDFLDRLEPAHAE